MSRAARPPAPEVRAHALPNGLRVALEPRPAARGVALGFRVDVGARDEPPEIAGASHLLEHMLFKGVAPGAAPGVEPMDADALNDALDDLGARANAWTGDEATALHGACLPDRAPRLLALFAAMLRPAVEPDDLELERAVVLEEIAMTRDRPDARLFDAARERFWAGHPLGRDVLGSAESVAALDRERLLAHHAARYVAGSVVFAAVGAFDPERMLDDLARLTDGWPAGRAERPLPPARPREGLELRSEPGLARARVALHAPGVARDDPRRAAAEVLAECLGGDNGRLHWALVDPGLADEADLVHEAAWGAGAWVGWLDAAPERLEPALERLERELAAFERGGPDEAEWARARRRLATGLALRSEGVAGRLDDLLEERAERGRPRGADEAVADLLAASADDARALLAERPFARRHALALEPARDAPAGERFTPHAPRG